jgi:hypothetical protein
VALVFWFVFCFWKFCLDEHSQLPFVFWFVFCFYIVLLSLFWFFTSCFLLLHCFTCWNAEKYFIWNGLELRVKESNELKAACEQRLSTAEVESLYIVQIWLMTHYIILLYCIWLIIQCIIRIGSHCNECCRNNWHLCIRIGSQFCKSRLSTIGQDCVVKYLARSRREDNWICGFIQVG